LAEYADHWGGERREGADDALAEGAQLKPSQLVSSMLVATV
jgi:hypothetical protein